MNNCLCCSSQLLRHIRHNEIYWFCQRCRQEMPALNRDTVDISQEFQRVKYRNPRLYQEVLNNR